MKLDVPSAMPVCKRRAEADAVTLAAAFTTRSASYKQAVLASAQVSSLILCKDTSVLLLLLKGQFHSSVVRQCWVIIRDHVSKLIFP